MLGQPLTGGGMNAYLLTCRIAGGCLRRLIMSSPTVQTQHGTGSGDETSSFAPTIIGSETPPGNKILANDSSLSSGVVLARGNSGYANTNDLIEISQVRSTR